MARASYRVKFPGGAGFDLAGIIDRPDHIDTFPVTVFSHCFTCNKDLKAIVRISRGLAERGVAVLRFDMTGLGGSGGDFAHTSFSTNRHDLLAAIRFAAAELGPVTALMGHSFGGAASMSIAGSGHDDIADLRALLTLAAPSDTTHLAALLAKMDPRIEAEGAGQVSIGGRSYTIRREMLEDFRNHDLPKQISRINAPTLVFHSPVDKTVGFDHGLRIVSLIHGAESPAPVSLVSLAGADHLVADRQADIDFVVDASSAFIRRYASPDAQSRSE